LLAVAEAALIEQAEAALVDTALQYLASLLVAAVPLSLPFLQHPLLYIRLRLALEALGESVATHREHRVQTVATLSLALLHPLEVVAARRLTLLG
jgi:hypothetical protein